MMSWFHLCQTDLTGGAETPEWICCGDRPEQLVLVSLSQISTAWHHLPFGGFTG